MASRQNQDLVERAKSLGITINKRWSDKTIQSKIDERTPKIEDESTILDEVETTDEIQIEEIKKDETPKIEDESNKKYVIANGYCITTRAGIKASGMSVLSKYFKDEETFNDLKRKNIIVEEKK